MTYLELDALENLDTFAWTVDGEAVAPVELPPPCDPETGLRVWLKSLETPVGPLWGHARWDDGRWSSRPSSRAYEVTGDVTALHWRRGAPNLLEPPEAGEVGLELRNQHGRYSPLATLVPEHLLRLDAAVPVFVTWDHPEGFQLGLFAGFLGGISDVWEAGNPSTGKPERAWAVGDGTDVFALLNSSSLDLAPTSLEPAGDRIARILEDFGWPLGIHLEPGRGVVPDPSPAQSHLEEIQRVAVSEGGAVFVDGAGDFVYHDRDHQTRDPRATTVQVIFTDRTDTTTATAAAVVCYDQAQALTDRSTLVNHAEIGTASIAPQVADDVSSQAEHGVRALVLTDTLLGTPLACQARANRLVAQFADATQRVQAITVDLMRRPEARAAVCGLDYGDRIRFIRHPPSGDVIDLEVTVTALSHDVTPDSGDATLETGPVLLEADHARWGSALWGQATWTP